MLINYNKILLIIGLILIKTAFCSTIYAQKMVDDDKSIKVAADKFYKFYLPQFGYPTAAVLKKLHPFLSESLYSALVYERKRMELWTAKNPGEKPPVSEDLFVCNHEEPPEKFQTVKTNFDGLTGSAIAYFTYADNDKFDGSCETKLSFIRVKNRWLLDNIIFVKEIDLKRLLSRKDYEVLPEPY